MLLLLETDRVQQAAARAAAEHAGLELRAVDHEDQFAQVDLTKVALVLARHDWPAQVLEQLRASGLDCPFIYVASETEDDTAYQIAKERGCVDVVAYPLPMEYLKRWIREPDPEQASVESTLPMTPLEAILKRHRPPNPERTRDNLIEPSNDPEPLLRGRVICIHSARGGVGKSTLTALLARSLSKRGLTVGVIDLDPKGNLLSIQHQSSGLTTDDFTRLPAQMDETAFKESLCAVDGWYLLPSGRARDGLDDQTLGQVVAQFSRYFDVTLIDTSPSAAATYTALEFADRVVFVMTPEWMAFARFMEEYELVRHLKTPERVVVAVNRVRKNVSEHRRAIRLLDEAHILSDRVYIPEDHKLYRDLMTASPLAGSRKISDAMEHLQGALRVLKGSESRRPKFRLGKIREVVSK
ncbi:ParA family protein [Alicyclobacillus sp. ALC3]|uniref:ParA family protein n=1 Tax=Alicyclobacillus sp. ALC3 TaxID=2796143 RepID=UPI0023783C78|nr:AAA family ATPase [Alicyclobacillus sp. ALC3]WDL96746.1 AAA family ATPase [Alicyclobacillus sp. ALC3]